MRSREVARAIGYGGGAVPGFVWPSTSRLVEDSDGTLATGALGAFAATTATTSLTVSLASGEAVTEGAYMARDVATSITLPANDTTDIYVGYRDGQADTVLIGEPGTTVGDSFTADDARQRVWTFTTDANGVTGSTDRRRIGTDYRIASTDVQALTNMGASRFTGYPLDPATDVGFSAYPLVAADIATNAIGAAEIAANAVGQSEIATNGVSSAEIVDGSVRLDNELSVNTRAVIYGGL